MLELGFRTGRYVIWYKDGESLEDKDDLSHYMKVFPHSRNHRIWYDIENKSYFSQAQFRNTIAGKDCHFNSDQGSFLNGPWGINYCQQTAFKWGFHKDEEHYAISYNNDIVYGNNPAINNNKDKSVLIIAGGPSVDAVKWENLTFDQIWSCNQYFLNEKVASHKIDLVSIIAGLFDYVNEERFIELMNRDNTLVSFEAERGHIVADKKNYEQTNQFCTLYPKNSTFFHTRYRAQLGIGLRMVAYAAQLGYKDIYFIGLDGRSKIEENNKLLHAFNGEKPIPNWYKKYGDLFQERHFIIFWDYLEMLSKQLNFNFYNLGEDTEFNVMSKLFSEKFPLPKGVKDRLL